MSSSRMNCCASAILLFVFVLMLPMEGDSRPLGLGLLDFLSGANETSALAALALAHIEHTIDKLNALAEIAETVVSGAATAGV